MPKDDPQISTRARMLVESFKHQVGLATHSPGGVLASHPGLTNQDMALAAECSLCEYIEMLEQRMVSNP